MSGIGKDAPYRDFSKRLEQAADALGHEIPPHNFGRLGWFQDQLEKKTGNRPTAESVRRWRSGLALPRKATLEALAEIFRVDAAWLVFGAQGDRPAGEQRLRNAEAAGVVNVLAGVIQMDGGYPAFPQEGEDTDADLFAIIRGARYSFRVVLGEAVEAGYSFTVPARSDDKILIGVVRTAPHNFAFYELDPESARREGRRPGVTFTVVADPKDLRRIESFGQRI